MNEMIVFDTKNYNPTRRGEKTVKSLIVRLGTVRTVVILSLSVKNCNIDIGSLNFDKSRRQYKKSTLLPTVTNIESQTSL